MLLRVCVCVCVFVCVCVSECVCVCKRERGMYFQFWYNTGPEISYTACDSITKVVSSDLWSILYF